MPTAGHNDVSKLEAGMLLLGLGAVLLFVSLFLEWYQPRIDAWEIFEAWDLVLALLAVGALVAIASRLGFGPPWPAGRLPALAVAALVVVLYALLNPPPLISGGVDGDPGVGLWLALVAAILMTVGAVLSVARVSVVVMRGPVVADAPGGADAVAPPRGVVSDPVAPARGSTVDPLGRGPFAPRAGAVEPAPGSDETVPPPPGRRFARGAQPPTEGPTPPTEPTRKL